ncbi:MAG: hypothetical protein IJ555_14880 [Ruminococcus sp.]|nr:hypothetical protein [Ruminococcus sp.]MBR1752751.1 hypothetical protein [Ruminococcus sp.]
MTKKHKDSSDNERLYSGDALETLLDDIMNDDDQGKKAEWQGLYVTEDMQSFHDSLSMFGYSDERKLSLMLSFIMNENSAKKLSNALIKKYRRVSRVMLAPEDELMLISGIDERTLIYIKALMRFSGVYALQMQGDVNTVDRELLKDYLLFEYSGSNVESAKLFVIDKNNRLMPPVDISSEGGSDLAFNLNKAMNAVINTGAKNLIISHSHLPGSAEPSESDVVLTRRFSQMLDPLGAMITDHFIICDTSVVSMRSLGLIDT